MMAIVSGVVCVAAGLARLGFITELLSKPIRYGYMNGIALTVILSQIPEALRLFCFCGRTAAPGVGNHREYLAGEHERRALRDRRRHAGADSGAEAVAARPRHPDRRVALRPLSWQRCDLASTRRHFRARSFAAGVAGAQSPDHRHRQPDADPDGRRRGRSRVIRGHERALSNLCGASAHTVDPNQEMLGLGIANLATGFFQGFPISSSSSRTPVAEAAGARTQLTGVVGALAIALLLLLHPSCCSTCRIRALAAVVIASAIGLIEVSDLRRIYRIQRWEFWLSMACFAGVAVLGAIPGIALAIVIAVIEFLWDGWRPHSAVLGRVDQVKGYHDITRYPEARQIPGLVLFRWDAPLFFANAELFHERVLDAVQSSPTPVRWLVVAAEPVTSIDVTAADAIIELHDTLHAGCRTDLCRDEGSGQGQAEAFRPLHAVRRGHVLCHHRRTSVNAYLAARPVEWVDWEDRTP